MHLHIKLNLVEWIFGNDEFDGSGDGIWSWLNDSASDSEEGLEFSFSCI